jgi:hypothetical protein
MASMLVGVLGKGMGKMMVHKLQELVWWLGTLKVLVLANKWDSLKELLSMGLGTEQLLDLV